MKTLSKLKPGTSAEVTEINESGAFRRRLFDMGITPGVKITLLKTAPLGDPIEIFIRGYHLSLRKEQADKIMVSQIRDEVK